MIMTQHLHNISMTFAGKETQLSHSRFALRLLAAIRQKWNGNQPVAVALPYYLEKLNVNIVMSDYFFGSYVYLLYNYGDS